LSTPLAQDAAAKGRPTATGTSASNSVETTSEPAATVGVVIVSYNQAHYLSQALESVRAQRRPCDRLVVVDDGSTDNPAAVVAGFPHARLITQQNRGLAAARNAGLAVLDTSFVVFLDADDRLEPNAIELGLACFARVPESGFVYGGHLYIDADGQELGGRFEPPREDPYLHFLRGNFIAMHGAVMYRRDCLLAVGGFDETLRRCEDYDLYLRLTRRYQVTGYPDLVASYRLHGNNMSANHREMLRSALQVHARYKPSAAEGPKARQAWLAGRGRWRRNYAEEMALARYLKGKAGGSLISSLPAMADITAAAPRVALGATLGGIRRRVTPILPHRVRERLLKGRERVPPVGRVRFGDLRRVTPISDSFGFDRGLPVDRHYIERFLTRHYSEIVGRVLEIGDDSYTRRFGGTRVSRSDVLHVKEGNPRATLVGDITKADVLPENAFNCIILTQTLQLIYDVPLAIERIHRALVPGGVVLVTAPGISQISGDEWGKTWFWSFTPAALERLFVDRFGSDGLMIERYGNVFAATAFLQGLAVEELDVRDLVPLDNAYPVITGLRARKTVR